MAITPGARTSGTSADIALPAHSAGDIILLWTYRSGGNLGTLPSDGSGGGTWTLVLEGASNSNAAKLQILVATGSGHTATGGTLIDGWEALVYSGVNLSGPYGGSVTNGANSPTVTFGGVTMTVGDGSSRIVSFMGTENSSSDSSSPPSPLVRIGATTDAIDNTSTACFDTNGGVSSFSGGTMAQGAFTAYRTASIELIAADDGGGSVESGAGSASGSSSVSGVGASIASSVGSSAGAGTASGVGASIAAAVGSAAGVATVSGVGQDASSGTTDGVGTAAGTSSTSGVGASIASAVGSASGTSTATGVSDFQPTGGETRSGGFYPVRKRRPVARPKSLKDRISELVDEIVAEQERSPPQAGTDETPLASAMRPGATPVDLGLLLGDLQTLKLDLAGLEVAALRNVIEERLTAIQDRQDEDVLILLLATM